MTGFGSTAGVEPNSRKHIKIGETMQRFDGADTTLSLASGRHRPKYHENTRENLALQRDWINHAKIRAEICSNHTKLD